MYKATIVLIAILIGILPACSEKEMSVKGTDFSLSFNAKGEIENLELNDGSQKQINGFSSIKGLKVQKVESTKTEMGISFKKEMLDSVSGRTCTLIETFEPGNNSIHWKIEVVDDGEAWSAPIQTTLSYPVTKSTKIWMPWADPRGDISGGGTDNALIANAIINSGDLSDFNSWADPLQCIPLKDALWHYGAPRYTYQNPGILYCPFQGDVICIPMMSFIEEEEDFGLSLMLSPEDLLLDINLETKECGEIKFSRFNHRIGKDNKVSFSMDLVVHEADWRGSMAWMVENYPKYFYPTNKLAQEIAGTGAYSNSDVSFDVEKMKKMGFRVNWRASFDFPFMGMFIPPVDDDEVWPSFVRERNIGKVKRKPTSIPKMREYCKRMDDFGFNVLNYFNVTEFGTVIKYPRPETKRKAGEPIWKHANDYLYEKLEDAMLYVPEKQIAVTDKGIYSAYPGKPFFTWEKAVAMDPGVKSYQDFLVEQAERTVEKLPNSYGICIDRMDWTRFYNHRTDDGVSWMGDQPVGSMYVSWHKIMDKLNTIFHDNNKLIFVNNHVKRIEQLRYVDGIFDEFTYAGSPLNAIALMGTHKPTLGWMSDDSQLLPDPDKVMQKYLYMGIFPMAPFPGNDHSIRPSELADRVYLEYGAMFNLMRGKEWVLKPHVITAKDDAAKVNLFRAFHGYTIPVTYATKDEVEIIVNDSEFIDQTLSIEAYYPGEDNGTPISYKKKNGKVIMSVPVKRGCAMLKVQI